MGIVRMMQSDLKHFDFIESNDTVKLKLPTPRSYYLSLVGQPTATVVGGQKDGETIEGIKLKANQTVRLNFGSLRPAKFHVEVMVPIELMYEAQVQTQMRLEPNEAHDLSILLTPRKELDMTGVEEWARVYLID